VLLPVRSSFKGWKLKSWVVARRFLVIGSFKVVLGGTFYFSSLEGEEMKSDVATKEAIILSGNRGRTQENMK